MPQDTGKGVLLRLHATDNVLVATGPVGPGCALASEGGRVDVQTAVTLGHKVAASDIGAGEKIVKYGVPIGSATQDIPAGAHVHVHNMQSDYTPTHVLDATAGGAG